MADPQATEYLQILISSLTPIAVIGLIRMLRNFRSDMRRFMSEHLFLIAHANWSVTSIKAIMKHLNLTYDDPPKLKDNGK